MLPDPSSFARRLRREAARVLPRSVLLRRIATGRRAVSLTFDDGPDEHTPELLDLLDALRLRGTFFVLGENVRRFPAYAREIERRGHDLASHGWAHRAVVDLPSAAIATELARVESLLPRTPGRRPLFRPPRGELSVRSLATIAALGYTTVLWSFDSLDSRPIGPEAISRHFSAARIGPGEVILLHEGERATREALPTIAAALTHAGLGSLPVSTLLAR